MRASFFYAFAWAISIGHNIMAMEKSYNFQEIKTEMQLLIRYISPVTERLAKEYDLKGRCINIEYFLDRKEVRPIFALQKIFDINEARIFAFEFVKKYRTLLAEIGGVKQFYKVHRPKRGWLFRAPCTFLEKNSLSNLFNQKALLLKEKYELAYFVDFG